MRFTALFLSGLAAFSLLFALAAPTQANSKSDLAVREALPAPAPVVAAPIEKRGAILQVCLDLKAVVAVQTGILHDPFVTAIKVQASLQIILGAIQHACTSLPKAAIHKRQSGTADDLVEVGKVLAEIIKDIVEAVEGLADNLKALPLIGALIIAIDGGLHTLLLGVELVLAGVLAVVAGLLGSLSVLLGTFGTGLLAGLIFP